MYIMLFILSMSLLSIIALGVYYEIKPFSSSHTPPIWLKKSIGINLLTFIFALLALLFLSIQQVMAVPTDVVGAVVNHDISIGKGLALIGIGLPTSFATIGAGISVGPIGAASLAAISDKPENFGRSLIYLGLAEGIAIYGLVVTILLMSKI
jgi:V/A-type H+/Na+-transporting ATPase subunit K